MYFIEFFQNNFHNIAYKFKSFLTDINIDFVKLYKIASWIHKVRYKTKNIHRGQVVTIHTVQIVEFHF